MDLTRFLTEECSSLCMDDEEDRTVFNERFQKYLQRGMTGMQILATENKITDNELDAALNLVDFILKFARNCKLPTLLMWASAEYAALNGIKHNRNLEWPKGNVSNKTKKKKK